MTPEQAALGRKAQGFHTARQRISLPFYFSSSILRVSVRGPASSR